MIYNINVQRDLNDSIFWYQALLYTMTKIGFWNRWIEKADKEVIAKNIRRFFVIGELSKI